MYNMQLEGEIDKDTICSIQYALEWKMVSDNPDKAISVLICNILTFRSAGTQNRVITKLELGDLDSHMTTHTGSTEYSDAMAERKIHLTFQYARMRNESDV